MFTEKTEENNNDEQGTWEESFGGNTDSKPRGPQAIAMDFTFVGTKHIYGVPEHADRFSLQDTSTSDPYRLVYIHLIMCYAIRINVCKRDIVVIVVFHVQI